MGPKKMLSASELHYVEMKLPVFRTPGLLYVI